MSWWSLSLLTTDHPASIVMVIEVVKGRVSGNVVAAKQTFTALPRISSTRSDSAVAVAEAGWFVGWF